MINAQLLHNSGILIVTPAGKLETSDFDRMRLLVNAHISKHGNLKGMLIDADEFQGWEDFASMFSHIRFANNYEDKIERVAAISDGGFMAIIPKLTNYFSNADVRHFTYEERDLARKWLRTGRMAA